MLFYGVAGELLPEDVFQSQLEDLCAGHPIRYRTIAAANVARINGILPGVAVSEHYLDTARRHQRDLANRPSTVNTMDPALQDQPRAPTAQPHQDLHANQPRRGTSSVQPQTIRPQTLQPARAPRFPQPSPYRLNDASDEETYRTQVEDLDAGKPVRYLSDADRLRNPNYISSRPDQPRRQTAPPVQRSSATLSPAPVQGSSTAHNTNATPNDTTATAPAKRGRPTGRKSSGPGPYDRPHSAEHVWRDGTQPIPPEVQQLVARIKNSRRDNHGIWVRTELRKSIPEHFTRSMGILKEKKILKTAEWFGDTRLFTRAEWKLLDNQVGKYTNNVDTSLLVGDEEDESEKVDANEN